MSKRHSDSTRQKNARRGAITRQCPECKRKAAMSAWVYDADTSTMTVRSMRTCRYCGFVQRKEVQP